MQKINCSFCGKELSDEDDRIIFGNFFEEIAHDIGRIDYPDIFLCSDCYQRFIKNKTKF